MKKFLIAALFITASFGALVLAVKMPERAPQPKSAPISVTTPALSLQPPAPENTASTAESIQVPILVYHHIAAVPKNASSATKSFYIEPEWFERHLQYLQRQNYQTIRMEDLAAYFNAGTPLPVRSGARPVVINFDDGWKNTIENAYPLLQKYGMIATVFIPTNLVGKGVGGGRRMTWEDLQVLQKSGWEIGSHTLWHPYLTKSGKARQEIVDSKLILEEKLGAPVTVFAYPFGDFNLQTEALTKEAGYSLARSFSEKGRSAVPTGLAYRQAGKRAALPRMQITRENLFHLPVVRVWGNLELPVFLKN